MTSTVAQSRVDSPIVTNRFVDNVYDRLSHVYDMIFGLALQPGRMAALQRMRIDTDANILEVGVGTGLNAPLYPRHCCVTGIDISRAMLKKAHERITKRRIPHVRLVKMDAARLTFADNSFDIVYAPYTISVVPDPVQVAREMRRVCKPGGQVIFLNHFRSPDALIAGLERAASPFTVHVGFRLDLELSTLLAGADLTPTSIHPTNFPPIWQLVICHKDPAERAAGPGGVCET